MNLLINLPEGFFIQPELRDVFERAAALADVRKSSYNTADEIRADLARADAVLMWSWPVLTPELLNAAPGLKFAGFIDVTQRGARALLERGLPVSVSRHGFSPAVAEMALGLALSVLRRIPDYVAQMARGSERWVKAFPTDIDPRERELTGRRVGIIGFGRVGRRLAELLQPFHCDLRVYDPFLDAPAAERLGAKAASLDSLVESCDLVVLCAASNPGTHHLIGAREIGMLPENAVFINVARAALVDTAALAARLEKGDLFAALDVFDREPLGADAVLRRLPNAYLTPHRAGGVIASVQRNIDWLVEDLAAFQAGKPLSHALTEAMLPGLDA